MDRPAHPQRHRAEPALTADRKGATPDKAAAALAADASRILGEVGRSLAGLLESLPHPPARAVDVARMLKLHAPLAWQVFRIAGAAEPLAAVGFLPTSNQLGRVVQAAADAGAPRAAVDAASRAARRLDEFTAAHARDRREFESLIASLSPQAGPQIDMRHRRTLFRSNAHVWGIQARAGYAAMIVHETAPAQGETVMIGGYVGLHVLRADVPMSCAVRTGVRSPAGEASDGDQRTGAQPLPLRGQTRLIAGAASDRRLRLATSGQEDGEAVSMIRFPGIGRHAAVSFFLEQAYVHTPDAVDRSRRVGHSLTSQVRVPSEALVLDLLVPARPPPERFEPTVSTYGRRQGVDRVWERRAIDILPTSEHAVCVGGIVDVPPCPDIPRLPQIVRQVLSEHGWHGERFDLYRCRVEYPILHAMVCMNAAVKRPARRQRSKEP